MLYEEGNAFNTLVMLQGQSQCVLLSNIECKHLTFSGVKVENTLETILGMGWHCSNSVVQSHPIQETELQQWP